MPDKKSGPELIAPERIVRKRDENFISRYANYSYLESSLWDLKMIFGEIDQSGEPNVVPITTALTLPWPQIKVLTYFLRLHLEAYEQEHGRIKIPPGIILPPVPDNALVRKFYTEFVAENPEAAQKK